MKKTWIVLLSALLLALALAVLLLHKRETPIPLLPDRDLQLRTYQVPGTHGEELREIIARLMSRGGEQSLGKVEVAPGNMLVVLAPPGVHEGIESLLRGMATAKPASAPPPVTISYWLVLGRPTATATDTSRFGEIGPAIEAIQKSQGPMDLQMVERLKVSSAGNRRASITGRLAEVRQSATVTDGTVVADITVLGQKGWRVETRVQTAPGKLVVMAQSGYRTEQDVDDAESVLYYIIRADVG